MYIYTVITGDEMSTCKLSKNNKHCKLFTKWLNIKGPGVGYNTSYLPGTNH